jgi:hypothetical protein
MLLSLDDKRLEKRRSQLANFFADVVALAERHGRNLWQLGAMQAFSPHICAALAPAALSPAYRAAPASDMEEHEQDVPEPEPE